MSEVVSRLPTLRASAASPWCELGAATAGFVGLVALAAADGGYFAPAWGCAALVLGWIVVVALLARAVSVTRFELAFVALFAAVAGWTWLSAAWSPATELSIREGFRALLLPLGAAGGLVFTRSVRLPGWLAVAWAGIVAVCAYALATRLLPERLGVFDPIAGYRLSEPLGYWNGLGLLGALGLLLAVGLITNEGRRALRLAAASSLPMLALATYFTFSRGAWAAIVLGVLMQLLLDPRRGHAALVLLALAPAPALAVVAGSRSSALTRVDASLGAAAADGHRLLGWLLVITACAAGSGFVATQISRRRERQGRFVLALAVGVAAVAVVGAAGSPLTLPERAWNAFSAPTSETGGDLGRRLYSLSGSGRVEQWKVALEQARQSPLAGEGAGSYEAYWLQHRSRVVKVRDAHSLYLEFLAELGIVGLGLLLAAVLVPAYVAIRARRRAFVPAAFGAYVAYVVHAGVDWDWEMPVLTLTALFIGAGIVVASRDPGRVTNPQSAPVRAGALALTLALACVAFVGLVGNIALSHSERAASAGDWRASIERAETARTWAPWSPDPYRRIGDAELALGRSSRARASYRRAIEKAPRDWTLWFDLARASSGVERRRALARAAELNPLSPEIARFRKELRQ